MSKLAWGRKACVYVTPVVYDEETGDVVELDEADLTLVRRLQDVNTSDEAKQATASARDLSYEVNHQAGKTFELTGDKLIEVADAGADLPILRDAFDDGSDLWVLVTRGPRDVDTGEGLLFMAQLFGWPENLPETEAVTTSLSFRPVDPDSLPTRVATPYPAD